MASSNGEGETLVHVVNNYIFLDKEDKPISFSILPLQWSEEDKPHCLPKAIFLMGRADDGIEKFKEEVIAWKFQLQVKDKYPEVSVLTKENNWVKLLHPRNCFEDAARTILVTLHFLHHIKKHPETPREYLWDQLRKLFKLRRLFSSHKVRPGEHDLLDHLPLIREAFEQDETLSKSQLLATLLEDLERKKVHMEEHIGLNDDELSLVTGTDHEDSLCEDLYTRASRNTMKDASSWEVQWETVQKRLRSIVSSKELGTKEKIEAFGLLTKQAATPAQKLQILMCQIQSQLETNSTLQGHMPIGLWRNCIQSLFVVFELLEKNLNIRLDTTHDLLIELKETKRTTDYDGEILMFGNLVGIIVRVYAEYFWGLASLGRNVDYVKRLKDEPFLVCLCKKAVFHFEKRNEFDKASTIALLLVQLMCPKSEEEYSTLTRFASQKFGESEEFDFPSTCRLLLAKMTSIVFENGNYNSRVRGTLCCIYHYAIMDSYLDAKNLMLESELLDTNKMEIPTQVLFNRVTVQIGLCAFRAGFLSEAHKWLYMLHASGKAKELIGQDISQWHFGDNIPKQENLERRLQTPYHLQVSMELFEAVYLISGMIVEIPSMAVSSRHRHTKSVYEFHSDGGVDDKILGAARALETGDFVSCFDCIRRLKVWDLVATKCCVLEMLEKKIKEASLIVYVLRHSDYCDSLSLDFLVSRFQLPKPRILEMLKDWLPGKLSQDETLVLFSA